MARATTGRDQRKRVRRFWQLRFPTSQPYVDTNLSPSVHNSQPLSTKHLIAPSGLSPNGVAIDAEISYDNIANKDGKVETDDNAKLKRATQYSQRTAHHMSGAVVDFRADLDLLPERNNATQFIKAILDIAEASGAQQVVPGKVPLSAVLRCAQDIITATVAVF